MPPAGASPGTSSASSYSPASSLTSGGLSLPQRAVGFIRPLGSTFNRQLSVVLGHLMILPLTMSQSGGRGSYESFDHPYYH